MRLIYLVWKYSIFLVYKNSCQFLIIMHLTSFKQQFWKKFSRYLWTSCSNISFIGAAVKNCLLFGKFFKDWAFHLIYFALSRSNQIESLQTCTKNLSNIFFWCFSRYRVYLLIKAEIRTKKELWTICDSYTTYV